MAELDSQSQVEKSQQESKDWHEILVEFFSKIGMLETNQTFKLELIVFSSSCEKQLPTHIEWLSQELTSWRSRNKLNNLSPSTKRKKGPDDESSYDESPAKKIQKLISPQIVQIKATNLEIEQRIDTFVRLKKSEINDSNRAEFLKKSNNYDSPEDVLSCARSDAAEINRNIQMKFDVVNNDDGPLARSTFSSSQRNDRVKRHLIELPSGVEERLQNIEKHLAINIIAPVPLDVYERIKILEAKIIQLERDYPPWAAVHFNQPNRQFPPPPPVTTIIRNPSNEIINNATKLPSGSHTLVSTKNVQLVPNSVVDGKQMFSSLSTQQNHKFSRTPRPIKPKGRGHGNSSLTRSIMEHLKMNRVANDNISISAKVTYESTESPQQTSNAQPQTQAKTKDVQTSTQEVMSIEEDHRISQSGNNVLVNEINIEDADIVISNGVNSSHDIGNPSGINKETNI
ncbi:15535_t:CDS:2 [Acaulospora morrowiae]|uniref:15535_t:CDS:1 n=1 Tax=Acaulospora morrowiae TaxID=94023 RepID=A0A9N9G3U1_9GLOM|nr:15535_t:CDS:2 [Acaulospora morrowiae]